MTPDHSEKKEDNMSVIVSWFSVSVMSLSELSSCLVISEVIVD